MRDWLFHYRARPAAPVPLDYDRLQPGQYDLLHQTAGTPRSCAGLSGVLLPVSICSDPLARAQLLALARDYTGVPWATLDGPSLSDLLELQRRYQRVGPLQCERQYRRTVVAYLELDCTPALYDWLRLRFRMAVGVQVEKEQALLVETAPLPARDLPGFASWFAGADPVIPAFSVAGRLSAALLYER